MNLKVEIEPVEKYKVTINGTSVGEFSMVSQWEGMKKLQSQKGVIIINHEEDLFSGLFKSILTGDKQKQKEVVTVAKITPCLIPVGDE